MFEGRAAVRQGIPVIVIPDGPQGRSGPQIKSRLRRMRPNLGPGSPLRFGRDDIGNTRPRTLSTLASISSGSPVRRIFFTSVPRLRVTPPEPLTFRSLIRVTLSPSARMAPLESRVSDMMEVSGPAYLYAFVEALEAAAIKAGFAPDDAATLARSTVTGAARLMTLSDASPAELRAQVTSPGGTTQ
eukprot:gene38252-51664_t